MSVPLYTRHENIYTMWRLFSLITQYEHEMGADDTTRTTVRITNETMEELETELSCFNTTSALFQYLAQFYLDYKQVFGNDRIEVQLRAQDQSPPKRGHQSDD